MQTTRWLDKENKSLDSVIEKIMSFKEDREKETGDKNFSFEKKFQENQEVILNSKKIIFNQINFKYDVIASGDSPLEERTIEKTGFVIVYNSGTYNNIIIDKYSGAESLVRKFLGYKSQKNKIELNMLSLSNNFFIWLINKVYNGDNELENEIIVKSIKGFKGDTEDSQTKVTADGETVMNIISALSFLLESKKLHQIKVEVEYREHKNIELTLSIKKNSSVISVDKRKYRGKLLNEKNDVLIELILIVYLELLPKIFQAYEREINDKEWNTKEGYINFIEEVGKDLSERIKNRIKDIKEN